MREVAARAGVAVSSVSRALAGHPDVSEDLRRRVVDAAEALGYRPNLVARGLRHQRTMTVGFVISDISNPLIAEIASGAEKVLREAGYSLVLTNSEGDPERDATLIELLEQRQVDGLLVSLAAERHAATIRALERLAAPAVALDRRVPARLGMSVVLSDHRAGMGAAADYLLDLGHRRVGLIVGPPVRPSAERRRALEAAFADRGLPADGLLVEEGSFSIGFAAEATVRLLQASPPPTAIVAGGNQLVVGALRALRDLGLEVGRDVSLVSCDDTPVTDLLRPGLAVVRRDNAAMGAAAAQLLLQRLDGADARTITLPTEFIARASCAAPPA